MRLYMRRGRGRLLFGAKFDSTDTSLIGNTKDLAEQRDVIQLSAFGPHFPKLGDFVETLEAMLAAYEKRSKRDRQLLTLIYGAKAT